MRALGITDAGTVRGCVLPMSHIVGPCVCNELADKGFTLVIFDQFNPVTLLEGIAKHRVSVFECVPPLFQLVLGVANLKDFDTQSLKIAAMMGTTVPLGLLRLKAAQPR
jgi:long-chain acyl-CoA synthetase